jgi:hypothetical protein
MPSEQMMKKATLRILFLLILVSAVYAGLDGSVEGTSDSAPSEKEAYEPAGTFVPTEKLRADDAIAFPVDI